MQKFISVDPLPPAVVYESQNGSSVGSMSPGSNVAGLRVSDNNRAGIQMTPIIGNNNSSKSSISSTVVAADEGEVTVRLSSFLSPEPVISEEHIDTSSDMLLDYDDPDQGV